MKSNYLKRILSAKVYDVARETELEKAANLSARLHNTILLKREDNQPVFSFKLRGAYNKMAQLSPASLKKGVIAASAGNHAQGVALAAAVLVRQIVVSVALAQQWVFVFGHIGRGMRQRGHERHADHIRGLLSRGDLAAHILHRQLDAAGDDGGGIEQGAVPVEGDQVKLTGSEAGHVKRIAEVRGAVRPAAPRARPWRGG